MYADIVRRGFIDSVSDVTRTLSGITYLVGDGEDTVAVFIGEGTGFDLVGREESAF